MEIVTYGDRHDPAIFEYAFIPTTCFFQLQFLIVLKIWGVLFITSFKFCRCFMEYQVLGEFVRVLKISKSSRIEAPLLQYLSIMIQNMDTDNAICKTNEYRMILSSLLPLFCRWHVLSCVYMHAWAAANAYASAYLCLPFAFPFQHKHQDCRWTFGVFCVDAKLIHLFSFLLCVLVCVHSDVGECLNIKQGDDSTQDVRTNFLERIVSWTCLLTRGRSTLSQVCMLIPRDSSV